LYTFFKSAINTTPPAAVVAMLEAWSDWLIRLAHHRTPDSYALGVLSLIPGPEATLRHQLAVKLMEQPDTTIRAVACADLIDDWCLCSEDTRKLILESLSARDGDARWLRAAAMILYDLPSEVERCILPEHCSRTMSAEAFLASCPPDVLADAFAMYRGEPWPLGSTCKNHPDLPLWKELTERLVLAPEHQLHVQAVREALYFEDEPGSSAVIACASQCTVEQLVPLGIEVIRAMARSRSADYAAVWSAIQQRATALACLDRFVPLVLCNLEVIDYKDNLQLVLTPEITAGIGREFETDMRVRRILSVIEEMPDPSSAQPALHRLAEALQAAPRKLFSTYRKLQRLADNSGSEKLNSIIESISESIDETVETQERLLESAERISDWACLCQ